MYDIFYYKVTDPPIYIETERPVSSTKTPGISVWKDWGGVFYLFYNLQFFILPFRNLEWNINIYWWLFDISYFGETYIVIQSGTWIQFDVNVVYFGDVW